MKVFAVAYPIHFDDTMAYGTHHFLTGFRMQCAGREGLLFGPWIWGHPQVRDDLRGIHLLTVDAYSRNLGSAALGEVLAVLVTVEDRGRTSLTFCFRVFDAGGKPVLCGFQTVACADPATGAVVAFPASVLERFEALADLDEPRAERTFRERALAGGRATAGLFADDLGRLATSFLAGPGVAGLQDVAETAGTAEETAAWVFSGQGTFDRSLFGVRTAWLDRTVVSEVVRRWLGIDVSPLWDGGEIPADLEQVGIFLQNVGGARERLGAGERPAVLIGHSFGELAAVTIAGCTDLAGGLALVCSRIVALRSVAGRGGLLAVAAPASRVRWDGCVIAGRSAPDRVTVAGPTDALLALAEDLRADGIGVVPVPSSYPFHHPMLAPAARAWRTALRDIPLGMPEIPVYSPIGRRLLGGGDALRDALVSALVRPFDLYGAAQDAVAAGVTKLVDVGTTGSLARLLAAATAAKQPETSGAGPAWVEPAESPETLLLPPLPARGERVGVRGSVPAATAGVLPAGSVETLSLPETSREAPARVEDGPSPQPSPRKRGEGAAAKQPGTSGAGPAWVEGAAAKQPETSGAGPAQVEGAVAAESMETLLLPPLPARGERVGVRGSVPPSSLPTIAIIGTGAVVPGSGDPRALFRQLVAGTTGIVDLARDPAWAGDFFVDGGAPDKTRSGLAGVVRDQDLVRPTTVAEPRWNSWSRGQQLLATAVGQCPRPASGRIWCLVGATADGFDDYDLALTLEAFGPDLDLDQARRTLAIGPSPAADRAPMPAISAVLHALWGPDLAVTVLDAACASSLYAVALGMRALEAGETDVVLAGGVFCPGPGNSCLFSQFDGLSHDGCRPFDADADGVVFGEGASVVVLRRLTDARAAHEPVVGVLRGAGLASDGLSPSANVPRQAGQILAMRRCYDGYGLTPSSVQVIEAHGTATPVGDATELRSLAKVFADAPVAVRSSKGLVGHTGWAAGTTSLVALCEAFAAGTLHGLAPHDRPCVALAEAPTLQVSSVSGPWPDRDGAPRRAAVDSFGFGGADAHVVLDAPNANLDDGGPVRPVDDTLVVVAVGGRFPADEARIPDGVGVLPDIAEDMDLTQTLALDVVGRVLAGTTPAERHDTALVVVHEGKTARGVEATQAVLADHLIRRLGAGEWSARIVDRRGSLRPSGPYTLQGMMPNVAAGRAASRLDLRGPNFAIDAGPAGIDRAFTAARLLLGGSASRVVVAVIGPAGAAAFVVTTAALAGERGLVSLLSVDVPDAAVAGAEALLRAVEGRASTTVSVGGGRGVQVRRPLTGEGPNSLRLCTPILVQAPLDAGPRAPHNPLFIAPADPDLVRALLDHGAVLTPPMARLDPRHHPVPLTDDLVPLDTPDVIVAVDRLTPTDVTTAAARDRSVLELLFLVARRQLADLGSGRTELWSLCLGGVDRGDLLPATGGYAGLLKSIAREVPTARVRAVVTDDRPLPDALHTLWTERAAPGSDEVVHHRGQRFVRQLQEVLPPSTPLPIEPGAVVLATGGARGITAALATTLLDAGATVIALGRSAPAVRPPDLPDDPEQAERLFYERLSREEPDLVPRALRQRFADASAAWEVQATIDTLGLQYRTVDVNDPDAVDQLVASILATHGRLDLVVHGAGVQQSARLDRRTLAMFRRTLDVKLGGVENVLRACVRHLGRPVPVHALTSAYSVFGNDGQADYGAANETLDRLCALGRRDHGAPWGSVAWLAWDGVGMTRGSEYTTLARTRDLSGLTPSDGRRVFDAALRSPQAITVPLSDREQRRYDVTVHEPDWTRFHEVRGRPTLPGAFALDHLVRAALGSSDGGTAVLEDIHFEQFARWGGGADPVLQTESEPDRRWTVVRLMGDVAHHSGVVLRRDVRFCRARVALQDHFDDDRPRVDPGAGHPVTDPYCGDGAVRLSGPFDCLRRIRIGPAGRQAWFDGSIGGQSFPALLLDAAWRLGAMHAEGPRSNLYVPVSAGRVTVERVVTGALQLRAAAPRVEDDVVCCPVVEAIDRSGRVVLRAEDSFARRLP